MPTRSGHDTTRRLVGSAGFLPAQDRGSRYEWDAADPVVGVTRAAGLYTVGSTARRCATARECTPSGA